MPGSLLDLNKNKYGIVNIYPGPQWHKAKWWDQHNDFSDRDTQGVTDGYRYNIGKKRRPLDYDMMNYQFAGYFKINTVIHLEDSRCKSEYPFKDEIVGQFYLHRSLHKNYKAHGPFMSYE
jgi:hypothetical protein